MATCSVGTHTKSLDRESLEIKEKCRESVVGVRVTR